MTFKETIGRLRLGQTTRFIQDILQPATISRRRLLVICLAVFIAAVGVRLLHWQNNRQTIDNIMAASAAGYKEEAQPLAEGDIRGFVRGHTPEPDTGLLIHTPGYPIFLATVQALAGPSNAALRLVQVFFSAVAAVLIVLIAVELLPSGAALLAGLFAAISPQLSFYSLVLLPDSLAVTAVLFGVYLLVRARKQLNYVAIIGAGAAIGVSCWLRANMVLLSPMLALVIIFWFPRAARLRYAALLLVATALVIVPITIRNAIVFRSFVPVSLSTGTNLTEGIADYDPEKRFGLERYDHTTAQQEAVMYNRPDYAHELYRPDGILRERLRVGRAWAVIKSNKIWFMGVMARRAGKMLTYEAVSIISVEPSLTNSIDTSNAELAWRGSPRDLFPDMFDIGPITRSPDDQTFTITADGGQNAFPLSTIKVRPGSDYLLTMPVRAISGKMIINLSDNGRTVASAKVPDSLDPTAPKLDELTVLSLPFVNPDADQLRIVVAKGDANSSPGAIQVGSLELYRLGPASYLWTKYPRVVVKTFQKFFTTRWMLPLALFGVVLLALARRFDALAIICAVPIYFIVTHAPIHLELRYILPINYFWGMLVVTSLYFMSMTVWKLIRKVKRAPRNA